MTITPDTTAVELATLVSQTPEAAGIKATLSGGGAVSVYTHNRYQSSDLDFVTAARRDALSAALRHLGFTLASDLRHFTHPSTALFLEFPAGPLEFGNRIVQHADVPRLETRWGPVARDHANSVRDGPARRLLALARSAVMGPGCYGRGASSHRLRRTRRLRRIRGRGFG